VTTDENILDHQEMGQITQIKICMIIKGARIGMEEVIESSGMLADLTVVPQSKEKSTNREREPINQENLSIRQEEVISKITNMEEEGKESLRMRMIEEDM
jgi:hypothetical protein